MRADNGLLEIHEADLAANTYTLKQTLLSRMSNIEVVAAGGKIYVVGGITLTQPQVATSQVDMYDPETDRWGGRGRIQGPLIKHAMTALDGEIYINGGSPFQGNYLNNPTTSLVQMQKYRP